MSSIKQTDTTLYSREITINGFDTLGNVLVNEVLDSVQLQIDTANYQHALATKQYELTNHLGNVLATVLDRKTPPRYRANPFAWSKGFSLLICLLLN